MKRHLAVLDGLRGTAAISVVIFHFSELSIGLLDPDGLWLRHAYLAVDFFFCLSGYVIGYAYDDRLNRMTVGQFLISRLIRLHPMVVAGLILGIASFVFDPFNSAGVGSKAFPWLEEQRAAPWKWAANVFGGLLMLPTWSLPNRFGSYFSLNSPAWSLMWEYVASIAYAWALWRLKKPRLLLVAALGAIGLCMLAYKANGISLGFAWGQSLPGLARITFSFCAGLLLFRHGVALKSRFGYGLLSAILVLIFIGPFGTQARLNWVYELCVVLLAFPTIVALGAGATTSGFIGRVCDLFGRVSYPMYMIHYAIIMVFANYHWTRQISGEKLPWVIALLTIGVIGLSYLVLILYDEPIRRWLGRLRRSEAKATNRHPHLDRGHSHAAPERLRAMSRHE